MAQNHGHDLDAHFLSVKYFLPAMRKKKWGRFVGISSNMIGLAIPGMSRRFRNMNPEMVKKLMRAAGDNT